MALSRQATDGVIGAWKNQHRAAQASWKAGHRVPFQVLPGGGKPTDQPDDAPPDVLPPNPNVDFQIDVYEAPDGSGWLATFRADDGTSRVVATHEDEPLFETDWAAEPPPATHVKEKKL